MCKDGKCGIKTDDKDLIEMTPEQVKEFSADWQINPEAEAEMNKLAVSMVNRAQELGVPIIIAYTTKMEDGGDGGIDWADSLSANLPGKRASKVLRDSVGLIKGELTTIPKDILKLLDFLK